MIMDGPRPLDNSPAVEAVLSLARKMGPLDLETERGLLARAALGDHKAAEEVVIRNAKYVAKLTDTFRGRGVPQEDLFFAGLQGLWVAVENFNPELLDDKIRFVGYGKFWIRQRLQKIIAEEGRQVRVPICQWKNLRAITEARGALRARGRLNPQVDELAMESGLKLEDVAALTGCAWSVEVDERDIPTVPGESLCYRHDRRQYVDWLLEFMTRTLSPREYQIFTMYLGVSGCPTVSEDERPTLEAVGAHVGLTRERVRQICKKSGAKVRRALAKECPVEMLDLSMW